jgi:hypothetical protein
MVGAVPRRTWIGLEKGKECEGVQRIVLWVNESCKISFHFHTNHEEENLMIFGFSLSFSFSLSPTLLISFCL